MTAEWTKKDRESIASTLYGRLAALPSAGLEHRGWIRANAAEIVATDSVALAAQREEHAPRSLARIAELRVELAALSDGRRHGVARRLADHERWAKQASQQARFYRKLAAKVRANGVPAECLACLGDP